MSLEKPRAPRPQAPGPQAPATDRLSIALRCTYCHDALDRPAASFCGACLAPHHAACHAEHGGCAAPACRGATVVRPVPLERRAAGRRWAAVAIMSLLACLTLKTVGLLGARRTFGLVAGASAPARADPTTPAALSQGSAAEIPSNRPAFELHFVSDGFAHAVRVAEQDLVLVVPERHGTAAWRLDPYGGAEVVLWLDRRADLELHLAGSRAAALRRDRAALLELSAPGGVPTLRTRDVDRHADRLVQSLLHGAGVGRGR